MNQVLVFGVISVVQTIFLLSLFKLFSLFTFYILLYFLYLHFIVSAHQEQELEEFVKNQPFSCCQQGIIIRGKVNGFHRLPQRDEAVLTKHPLRAIFRLKFIQGKDLLYTFLYHGIGQPLCQGIPGNQPVRKSEIGRASCRERVCSIV